MDTYENALEEIGRACGVIQPRAKLKLVAGGGDLPWSHYGLFLTGNLPEDVEILPKYLKWAKYLFRRYLIKVRIEEDSKFRSEQAYSMYITPKLYDRVLNLDKTISERLVNSLGVKKLNAEKAPW